MNLAILKLYRNNVCLESPHMHDSPYVAVIAVLALRAKSKGVTECSKCPLAARDRCFRVNFAGFPTLVFQIVFLLESACSNNSMSVGACAVVDIEL